MSQSEKRHLFDAVGLEFEYMIVDESSLDVRPIADRFLLDVHGQPQRERAVSDPRNSPAPAPGMAWSNELVLHVLEIKNVQPTKNLEALSAQVAYELSSIEPMLSKEGVRLLGTGMHPWMNPATEVRRWPHEDAHIYERFHAIFDTERHGWGNVQSLHINLPFCGDEEFRRLHTACRLILPLLPGLAASSPFECDRFRGDHDRRLVHYIAHCDPVNELIGDVIPDVVGNRDEYDRLILKPAYGALSRIKGGDGLCEEWVNARGMIPKFARSSLEIRLLDMQECPQADVALAALVTSVAQALVHEEWSSEADQSALSSRRLRRILEGAIQEAEDFWVQDLELLSVLELEPCSLGELWTELFRRVEGSRWLRGSLSDTAETMLRSGTLAKRLVARLGEFPERSDLVATYKDLTDCLRENRLFDPKT